jgi:hypothetical protein
MKDDSCLVYVDKIALEYSLKDCLACLGVEHGGTGFQIINLGLDQVESIKAIHFLCKARLRITKFDYSEGQ